LRFFAPQGRHVAPMGVKFGMEEGTFGEIWHGGGDLHAKFHPHRCNDRGVGPQKLKFLHRFNKNVNINAPQGRIPCAIFTKFAEFVCPVPECVSCFNLVGFTRGAMELWG